MGYSTRDDWDTAEGTDGTDGPALVLARRAGADFRITGARRCVEPTSPTPVPVVTVV